MMHYQIHGSTRSSDSSAEQSIQKLRIDFKDRVCILCPWWTSKIPICKGIRSTNIYAERILRCVLEKWDKGIGRWMESYKPLIC